MREAFLQLHKCKPSEVCDCEAIPEVIINAQAARDMGLPDWFIEMLEADYP